MCQIRTAGPPCLLQCIWAALFPVSKERAIPACLGRCVLPARILLFKTPNTPKSLHYSSGNCSMLQTFEDEVSYFETKYELNSLALCSYF